MWYDTQKEQVLINIQRLINKTGIKPPQQLTYYVDQMKDILIAELQRQYK